MNKFYCECGKEIGSQAKRCAPCNYKWMSENKINPGNYKTGSHLQKFCIDCNKPLVKRIAKRCKDCYNVVLKKRLKEHPVNKGRIFSEEHLKKMSLAKIGKPGNRKERKLTEEQRKTLSLSHGGTGTPRSEQPNDGYPVEFNKELKYRIFKRDNFTCQHPECYQHGGDLTVHHIDWNKNNLIDTNLITLCRSHNSKVNFNREYWIKHFSNKMT